MEWPKGMNIGDMNLSVKQSDELCKRFMGYKPKGDQPERYTVIKDVALRFACLIMSETPDSREQSLALTKIEEAVMWANAAIARNE